MKAYIYSSQFYISWSVSHIWEHQFYCFGHLAKESYPCFVLFFHIFTGQTNANFRQRDLVFCVVAWLLDILTDPSARKNSSLNQLCIKLGCSPFSSKEREKCQQIWQLCSTPFTNLVSSLCANLKGFPLSITLCLNAKFPIGQANSFVWYRSLVWFLTIDNFLKPDWNLMVC